MCAAQRLPLPRVGRFRGTLPQPAHPGTALVESASRGDCGNGSRLQITLRGRGLEGLESPAGTRRPLEIEGLDPRLRWQERGHGKESVDGKGVWGFRDDRGLALQPQTGDEKSPGSV